MNEGKAIDRAVLSERVRQKESIKRENEVGNRCDPAKREKRGFQLWIELEWSHQLCACAFSGFAVLPHSSFWVVVPILVPAILTDFGKANRAGKRPAHTEIPPHI